MEEALISVLPGVGTVTALVWLLARTFLRVEDRRDSEYQRLVMEILRKDEEIKRLEARIDELESTVRILRNAQHE